MVCIVFRTNNTVLTLKTCIFLSQNKAQYCILTNTGGAWILVFRYKVSKKEKGKLR